MMKCEDTKRILVVEDEPSVLHFWKRFLDDLEISHHDVIADPKDAKLLLENNVYHLLITDVVMPDVNGYELAKFARECDPEMEIILATAYDMELSRYKEAAKQQLHLLRKPFTNLDELKNLVSCLLCGTDVFSDASEDSWSDDEDFPLVTKWDF